MSYLIKPAGYKALLNLSQTEMGIKKIKDFFQQNLSSELRLRRVTAPLFVLKGMGINDDLNGTERAVTFPIKDLAAATAHNVCVMNTPGQNSNAVAELVFGMLVYAVRNFYNGTSGTELKGKKLGILAYGNVGRNVARIAKGFGMEVYAYDAFCPASVIEADGVKAVASTADLFKACQIVSLHIPATAETKGSINFELMNSMPKGAIVVNTARKEVMDEAGLAKMLEERPDFKYLTDIMPAIHAELAEKYAGRYFSTPKKMGAQTAEANINAGIAAAKQIVDFLVNGNEKYRVNK